MKRLVPTVAVLLASLGVFCLLRLDKGEPARTVVTGFELSVGDAKLAIDLSDPLLRDFRKLPVADDNRDPRITRFQGGTVLYHSSLSASRTLNRAEHPEDDLGTIEHLLSHYRDLFQENPVGINQEIVRQLRGDNHHNVVFLFPGEGMLSPEGELLDRWGSPYRFHALASTRMEIHSLGPDRELWTEDDLRSGSLSPE